MTMNPSLFENLTFALQFHTSRNHTMREMFEWFHLQPKKREGLQLSTTHWYAPKGCVRELVSPHKASIGAGVDPSSLTARVRVSGRLSFLPFG